MHKLIEFILCVVIVLSMLIGVLAFVLALFDFLMVDFTMVPAMLVCLIVAVGSNKMLIFMIEKEVNAKGY